jgi:pyruvate kinase
MRRTKILGTLGPASQEPAVLEAMLAAGLDAARMNFSHGTQAWHQETIRRLRAAAAKTGRPVAVLQDLQGPKVRVGRVQGQMELSQGARLVITTRPVEGAGDVVSTEYAALPKDVSAGTRILLDEGRIAVVVTAVTDTDVVCRVEDGGALSSHKGINIPGAELTAGSMTEKDRADVRVGLGLGVDYVALSMVRRASDVEELRALMRELGRVVPIVAKIEKPQALAA